MKKASAPLSALFTLTALMGLLLSVSRADSPPSLANQVKQQQGHFRAQRAEADDKGYTTQFSPDWFQRADALAKQADEAAKAGHLLEARDTLRRALWNLPAPAAGMPGNVVRTFGDARLRHISGVTSVAFSPDGKKVASASMDGILKIWDAVSGRELLHYTGHKNEIYAVAFSPDGKIIASAGKDAEIRIWDPATGDEVSVISGTQGVTGSVNALAFSPDGAWIASGGSSRHLIVHEVATGKIVRDLPNNNAPIQTIVFSPDGKYLLSGASDGLLQVFKVEKNQPMKEPIDVGPGTRPFPQGGITAAVFHPNSTQVFVAGSNGNRFVLHNPSANQENMSFEGHSDQVTCLAISRDGKTLASGSKDHEIRLWDVSTGACFRSLKGHRDVVHSLAFSPDGRRLASGSFDQTVRIWELGTGEQHRDLVGSTAPVWSAVFSPNGKLVVSAGADRLVRIWDPATGKELKALTGHTSPITAAVFSPDGKFILSASGDKTLKLWKADTFQEVRTFTGHTGAVISCGFSPDGTKAVSGGTDRLVKVWEVATGRELQSLSGHHSGISSVAWSEAGGLLASGSGDRTIRLWDAATGKPGLTLTGHTEAVSAVAFSRDGKRLASAGADSLVLLWDTQTAAPPARFLGHNGVVSTVAISNDGQLLASGGSDQLIKLWDIAARQELQCFRGHTDWVTSVAFQADDHFLVSASADKTIKIWEPGGREGIPDYGHQKAVDVLAISPDGKTLATGSQDKTIHLWDLATGRRKLIIKGQGDIPLSIAFTADSKRLIGSSKDSKDHFVRIWDAATGKELAALDNPRLGGGVYALLGLTTEQQFLAWVETATIDTYDAANGKRLQTLTIQNNQDNVKCLCFSPDGELAVLGYGNGSIRVWNIPQNKAVGDDFVAYQGGIVNDVVITADKSAVVSVDKAGQVKVWNLLDRRQPVQTLSPHKGKLAALAISPDGKRFATAGVDNVVKVWDRVSGQMLREWDFKYPVQKDDLSYGRAMQFTPDGKGLVLGTADATALLLQLP